MKLFLEIDTDEDLNAPLSEAELRAVEKAVAKVRAGDIKTTSDPAERDEWEAAGNAGVLWYRKPSRQEVPDPQ